ncbi:MAG TPA: thiopurine S-methyltransferase [Steroidobacteraceae bacterium]|nr:thiopurine S-methyltransferase [Steroidobacteraceae bacterium]
MQSEFWHERWRTGQIGFHQSSVDRNLKRHWPALRLGVGSRVFVPLCGKSLDMLWLRDQGHPVIGVELSVIALEAFCMENGIPARRRLHNGFEVYEATNLELLCGDFFALTRTTIQEVAAVYDRAALISWTQELRAPYVRHLTGLLKPGTPILLHALEYPQAQMPGPPFSLERGEIEHLYAPYCNIREIDRQDILATETRLRARGVTELCEVCYLMVRT